jgi:hypothetical protein
MQVFAWPQVLRTFPAAVSLSRQHIPEGHCDGACAGVRRKPAGVTRRMQLHSALHSLFFPGREFSYCVPKYRSAKLVKAVQSALQDGNLHLEKQSSKGSVSSSSTLHNGSVRETNSGVQDPKPFVAVDGRAKPGIFVISSPDERLTPQDSQFAKPASESASKTGMGGSIVSADRKEMPANTLSPSASSESSQNASGAQARVNEFMTGAASEQITDAPSCPMPNFATTATRLTLLQPVPLLPSSAQKPGVSRRPLLIYVPGMDGTGQGIRPQIQGLYTDG